jgi:cathepsin B
VAVFVVAAAASLPVNFTVSQKWPGCANFILNQQQCGSCWDFCSVESFADRLCITGEAPAGTIISPEPILDCSIEGCSGGNPIIAWRYLTNSGDTTCTNQCFAGCEAYVSGGGSSPKCAAGTCDDGTKWPTTYFGGSFTGLQKGNITLFQTELFNNGPLQACYTVYDNFYTFFDATPSGIYTQASGSVVGGHCVKLVGWGTEKGVDFWLFANSWDYSWGDSGYFRMIRGSNICGVENQISEGFTKKQAAQLKISGLHGHEDAMIVGGWHVRAPTDSMLTEPAHFVASELSQLRGEKISVLLVTHAETQVVAGINYKLTLRVKTAMNMLTVHAKVHKTLRHAFKLLSYEVLPQ